MVDIQTKAPGKLYIAGEYAVVEPGYSAIITAVDRFIYFSIKETSKSFGQVFSKGFTAKPVKWCRNENRFWFKKQNPHLKYVRTAIHTTEKYIDELGIPLRLFDIRISSELEDEANKKLGLGSSGAITVATVRGLLQFYGVSDDNELVYKLSVLAQLKLGVNSSFGDLAAGSFTGWVHYTSFDRPYVIDRLKDCSTKELVEIDWPSLRIERLAVPDDVRFLIGWTGSPASSNELVGDVQEQKKQSEPQYLDFLNESKESVAQLARALIVNDTIEMKVAIQRNRQALLAMGQQTNVQIETPQLKSLIEIAQRNGAVAKTSGAGGGDSGIAFVFAETNLSRLLEEWEQAGITHLPLIIYQK